MPTVAIALPQDVGESMIHHADQVRAEPRYVCLKKMTQLDSVRDYSRTNLECWLIPVLGSLTVSI